MKKKVLILPEGDVFSPSKTFNCGQCFRFFETEEDFRGVVGHALVIFPKNDVTGKLEYFTSDNTELSVFLDAERSYTDMNASILQGLCDFRELVQDAIDTSRGLRILKQDFFEALISFIISQNNNIPRIKKNVESLCTLFGDKFPVGEKTYHAFPTPEQILAAPSTALDSCKLGFRTKYVLDAARRVASGELKEQTLLTLVQAKEKLMSIHGVGPKVASCVLLYGLHDLSQVPVDVWMKKVFNKYFNRDFFELGEFGGVLQQYLFFRERYIIEGKKI